MTYRCYRLLAMGCRNKFVPRSDYTITGIKGSPGFAMKYYTEDGNWDLVGNNTPIFFIKDAK